VHTGGWPLPISGHPIATTRSMQG